MIGESHYTTLDGVQYTFDGFCTYKFIESTDFDPYFLITKSNIPCGASGLVCTRHITILVNGTEIELLGDTYLKVGNDLITTNMYVAGGIVIVKVDQWIVVSMSDLGLTLYFDGGM